VSVDGREEEKSARLSTVMSHAPNSHRETGQDKTRQGEKCGHETSLRRVEVEWCDWLGGRICRGYPSIPIASTTRLLLIVSWSGPVSTVITDHHANWIFTMTI